MGLDMYLIKKRKKDELNFENTSELIYWRKANEIHKYFIDKCANGEDTGDMYPVSKDQLEELKDICEEVLKKSIIKTGQIENGQRFNKDTGKWDPIYQEGKYIENPEVAESLLPRESGFFFGSTNYDEWYIEDLKYTSEKIKEILESFNFDEEEILYHAWW